MLHASETWALTKMNLQRLQCNDRALIRQICSIKPEAQANMEETDRERLLRVEAHDS